MVLSALDLRGHAFAASLCDVAVVGAERELHPSCRVVDLPDTDVPAGALAFGSRHSDFLSDRSLRVRSFARQCYGLGDAFEIDELELAIVVIELATPLRQAEFAAVASVNSLAGEWP